MATIVCDNGSDTLKAGFVGEKFPSVVIPTLATSQPNSNEKIVNVGDTATFACSPIKDGIVQNWDQMELIWEQLFHDKMRIDPNDSKVLMAVAPHTPLRDIERCLDEMFEVHGFDACRVQDGARLSLYSVGLLNGVAVMVGHGVTHVVPINGDIWVRGSEKTAHIGGHMVTQHLRKLLWHSNYHIDHDMDSATVRNIKEQCCYVATNINTERQIADETTALDESYTLPDGRVVELASERFEAPECLFDPSLVDQVDKGIVDLVFDAIQEEEDVHVRMEYLKYIVPSGGTVQLPGFVTRLHHQLTEKYRTDVLKGGATHWETLRRFKISTEDRNRRSMRTAHVVYVGATALADMMKERSDFWISRQCYEEEGAIRAATKTLGKF